MNLLGLRSSDLSVVLVPVLGLRSSDLSVVLVGSARRCTPDRRTRWMILTLNWFFEIDSDASGECGRPRLIHDAEDEITFSPVTDISPGDIIPAFDLPFSDKQFDGWRAAERSFEIGIQSRQARRKEPSSEAGGHFPLDLLSTGDTVPSQKFRGARIGYMFGLRGGVLGYHRDVVNAVRINVDQPSNQSLPCRRKLLLY